MIRHHHLFTYLSERTPQVLDDMVQFMRDKHPDVAKEADDAIASAMDRIHALICNLGQPEGRFDRQTRPMLGHVEANAPYIRSARAPGRAPGTAFCRVRRPHARAAVRLMWGCAARMHGT